jgi:hypothetical protein
MKKLKKHHSHTAGSPGANKGTPLYSSPYLALKAAGCEVEHRESDLYVRATELARRIIKESGWGYEVFQSEGKTWFEIPFAYSPFWEKRAR